MVDEVFDNTLSPLITPLFLNSDKASFWGSNDNLSSDLFSTEAPLFLLSATNFKIPVPKFPAL